MSGGRLKSWQCPLGTALFVGALCGLSVQILILLYSYAGNSLADILANVV